MSSNKEKHISNLELISNRDKKRRDIQINSEFLNRNKKSIKKEIKETTDWTERTQNTNTLYIASGKCARTSPHPELELIKQEI